MKNNGIVNVNEGRGTIEGRDLCIQCDYTEDNCYSCDAFDGDNTDCWGCDGINNDSK